MKTKRITISPITFMGFHLALLASETKKDKTEAKLLVIKLFGIMSEDYGYSDDQILDFLSFRKDFTNGWNSMGEVRTKRFCELAFEKFKKPAGAL